MTNFEDLNELRNRLLDLEVEAAQRGVLSDSDEQAIARARNLTNKVKAARQWVDGEAKNERSTVA